MGTRCEIDQDVRLISPAEATGPGGISLLARNYDELSRKRWRWAVVQETPNLTATPHPYVRVKRSDQAGRLVWGPRFELLLPNATSQQTGELNVNDVVCYVQLADADYLGFIKNTPVMLHWGKVQAGFSNASMAANQTVSVKSCEYDGSNVTGNAFNVITPIAPQFDTSLFEDNVVGYVSDTQGNLCVVTPCQDEPIGTLRPMRLETAIRQGWRICDEASCFDLRRRWLINRHIGSPCLCCISCEVGSPFHGPGSCDNHGTHGTLDDLCGSHNHGICAGEGMGHNCVGHTHDTILGHCHDAIAGHTHEVHCAVACDVPCGDHTHDSHEMPHECCSHTHAPHCIEHAYCNCHQHNEHEGHIHNHSGLFGRNIKGVNVLCAGECLPVTRVWVNPDNPDCEVPSTWVAAGVPFCGPCCYVDGVCHNHNTLCDDCDCINIFCFCTCDWRHACDGYHTHDPHLLCHDTCEHLHCPHSGFVHSPSGVHCHGVGRCAFTHCSCGEHEHACCGEHTHNCEEHTHNYHTHDHGSCGHCHCWSTQCWTHSCTDNRPPSKVVVICERFE